MLGPVLVIGGAVTATAAILTLWTWALGHVENRCERQEQERRLARHYGPGERP